jgi:hypothetical protein
MTKIRIANDIFTTTPPGREIFRKVGSAIFAAILNVHAIPIVDAAQAAERNEVNHDYGVFYYD